MNRAIIFIIAGLIYLLFPFDIVPDYIAIVGWLDDLFIAGLAVYMALQTLKSRVHKGPRNKPNQPPVVPNPRETIPSDPYQLLEIDPTASEEEIKTAYRKEMAKYHPDKVQHLGKELKEMAEQRTKAIQQAYNTLTS